MIFLILPVKKNPTNALNEYFNYLLHNSFVSNLKHLKRLIPENTYGYIGNAIIYSHAQTSFLPTYDLKINQYPMIIHCLICEKYAKFPLKLLMYYLCANPRKVNCILENHKCKDKYKKEAIRKQI